MLDYMLDPDFNADSFFYKKVSSAAESGDQSIVNRKLTRLVRG